MCLQWISDAFREPGATHLPVAERHGDIGSEGGDAKFRGAASRVAPGAAGTEKEASGAESVDGEFHRLRIVFVSATHTSEDLGGSGRQKILTTDGHGFTQMGGDRGGGQVC